MNLEQIFQKLWNDYTTQNKSALSIYKLFTDMGERIVNDHIAFRTFNDARMSIDVLAKPFLERGYVLAGNYHFAQKHLNARHYELPGKHLAPRVFISELLLEEFSAGLQNLINTVIDKVEPKTWISDDLIFSGSVFGVVSFDTYEKLRAESEYAAWMYVQGFRANHFTVSLNSLERFAGIEEVNKYLIDNGFKMNTSGGVVMGSQEQLLKQSSTMAEIVSCSFSEGIHEIPGCYYEFAERFKDAKGKLFSGFIAGSADKIFESTDYYKN